ncbi:fumarylacetoacetate hydrolase family protein [Marinilactibacillus sp. GCM10026970]|uniref:fumarylacetoacetate hydrolase family protein n=1 Tax=Marinilactibacillus sp. GCM10026970 TaxID=3252642 RepID=UPI0036083C05
MKLVQYYTASNTQVQLGIELTSGILNVETLAKHFEDPSEYTMNSVIQKPHFQLQLKRLLERYHYEDFDSENFLEQSDHIYYLPVVQDPEKIICVGMNYVDYVKEVDGELPVTPIFYNIYNNALAAHRQEIPVPSVARDVDYSAELIVVIGKEASNINEKQVSDYIFGYTIGNNLTDWTIQMSSSQWMLGKTLNFFAPIGPTILTSDELVDPTNLAITLKVNNEIRQQGNTKDMIFTIPYIISYLSRHITLKPGDLIFTGTPKGVIAGKPIAERQWLKQNDLLEVSIQNIGTLSNQLK